jgi:hypothetical protein
MFGKALVMTAVAASLSLGSVAFAQNAKPAAKPQTPAPARMSVPAKAAVPAKMAAPAAPAKNAVAVAQTKPAGKMTTKKHRVHRKADAAK